MMVLENDEKIKDIALSVENFVQRLRAKMVSPLHRFKKTDRLNIMVRYPQYKEENVNVEEKKEDIPHKIPLEAVIKKSYDSEILAQFKRFLEFIKGIFKGDDLHEQENELHGEEKENI